MNKALRRNIKKGMKNKNKIMNHKGVKQHVFEAFAVHITALNLISG